MSSSNYIADLPKGGKNQSGTETPKAVDRRRIASTDLFGKSRELLIEHAGDEYRLRITSQDKLLLTK